MNFYLKKKIKIKILNQNWMFDIRQCGQIFMDPSPAKFSTGAISLNVVMTLKSLWLIFIFWTVQDSNIKFHIYIILIAVYEKINFISQKLIFTEIN